LQVVNQIAPTDKRAAVVSSYFVCCFIGNALPVIGVGVLSSLTNTTVADIAFSCVIAAFAVVALIFGPALGPGQRRLVKPRGKPPADIVKKLACRRNKSWEIQFAHSSCSFPGRDNARLTALVSRAGTVTSKERHSRVPWDGTLFSLAGSAVVPTARGMFALSGKNRMPEGR
jgi:hypothetical protein